MLRGREFYKQLGRIAAAACGAPGRANGGSGPAQFRGPLRVRRSCAPRVSFPQRLHGPPASAEIWRASKRTSSAQPGRRAAMPVLCRTGTGAHGISRIGSGTKSTPPARSMAASRLQHKTDIPGGGRGSGASFAVNVRSW